MHPPNDDVPMVESDHTSTGARPLAGRVALVTGGSRGLGAAMALALARAGADVAVACRVRRDAARTVAEACASAGGVRATHHAADLAEPGGAAELVNGVHAAHGRLDILLVNAGVTHNQLLLRTTDAEWDRLQATNLDAAFRLCRAAYPLLQERGGHVVLVGSHAGTQGKAGLSAYGAGKAALVGLMRSLAREGGAHGIRANVVCPGYLDTDMGREGGAEAMERAAAANLLGGLGTVGEVAAFVAHLCTMQAVSGQVFHLDSRPA